MTTEYGGTLNSVGAITKVNSKNANGPVPDRLLCKFVYESILAADFTTNGTISVFCSNGLYSPNGPSGGTRPVKYFNEYSRIYGIYRVHATKITVRFISTQGSPNNEWYGFVFPTISTNAVYIPSSVSSALAYPNERHCLVGPPTGGDGMKEVTHFMRAGSLTGVSNIQDNENFAGAMQPGPNFNSGGTNPSTEEYFYVQAWGAGSASTVTGNITVRLEFWAELYSTFDPENYTMADSPVYVHPYSPPADSDFDSVPEYAATDMTDSVLVQKVVAAMKSSKK